ncbi:MAG: FAD-binding oxidoreductase [Gemmatimonadetes bacterium]|nr:FAD-binding oxidoreductase [Gemmatimonadota bacterium]
MADSYDVAIIGGGIMGCCTAYELARRGLKVILLEKDSIGGASTGRSSAIVRQHYSNELTARMALYSVRVFQHFRDLIGDDCGFHRTGFVALATASDREGLEANVALQRAVGIETSVLSIADLRELVPTIDPAGIVAAAYEPESGYADPHLTVSAYAAAARRHGAQLVPDTEVTGITFAGDRVTGVAARTGRYPAARVINCAGPWGARVAAMAGIEAPIHSCRAQVAVFRRPDEYAADHPVVLDFPNAAYYRAETGNLTIAGLIDPAEAKAVVDPDDYDETIDADFIELVGARFLSRFPMMASTESRGGFAGLYAITPDWHPIIDEVPEGSGHYLCTGFSGHGFKLGPAVGRMVADMVTEAASCEFDPRPFRLSRYAENDPVRGRYEYGIAG